MKQWAPLAAALVLVGGALLLMLRVTEDPPPTEAPPAVPADAALSELDAEAETATEPQAPTGQNHGEDADAGGRAEGAEGDAGSDAGPQTPETAAQAAASEALRIEDNFEAKAQAQLCLKLNPRNAECSSTLRMACGRSGDWPCLRVETDACLAREPENYDCLTSRVTLNARARKFKLAEADLAKLRAQKPEGIFTYTASAGLHLAKAEFKEALADYRAACELGQEAACLQANRLDTRLNGSAKVPSKPAPQPGSSAQPR